MTPARFARTRRWILLAAIAALAGCATNPVTGKPQLALISESQEISIGRESAQQAAASLGLVEDSTLQAYVQRVGGSLAAVSERPGLPWTFRVVEDATPNAFALPGGYIFVTRGLINLMNSEAELATVLGHEIGHVTARHSVTAISRQQVAQLGLGLGSVLVPEIAQFGGIASSGLGLLFLKYGRDAERQADELGFRYALDRRYDVREMADVFAALQRVGEREGQSPVPTWLATHPYPAERIEAVRERLATVGPRLDSTHSAGPEYLRRIDGLIYGENPRAGIFRNGAFLHPELRFQLSVPQGWRTQNTPQAVLAAAPQGDAVIQLTLAPQNGAADAARAFFSQQGVQAGQTGRETINGNPAVVGLFQAQTQGGVIRGLATWIEYGGRTYQILSYSPAQRFAAYDRTFRQSVGSFRSLTDPQILNLRPNRLAVVRIDAATTLADFNRRYPSVIPIEELALLNQVDGAASRLPAGALVKRVVAGRA